MSIFAAGQNDSRVVVHRPHTDAAGQHYRQVDFFGLEVGRAYSAEDVKAFMVRCAMDPDLFEQPGVVEWFGGGPEVWE
ncbi:hypothetical protein [Streptacidiphilus jiangxiensis]|uniref:Uncharacterized protein n=1 Tax=Streptacidiphilus jiangxiensis TaxID=235985 RepID=A0A1H7P7U8_STRJI|nr:hypothetical protein [Streptacidiphilus jiangxiensis]SEL31325.1 hypothetical protein SAMN05414137_107242 [Streptacidiphilus jiangxiensis]